MGSLSTVPECMHGHGPMSMVTNDDGSPAAYGAIASPELRKCYAFVAYRCPACSCVEFRDRVLPFESPAPERRVSPQPVSLERRSAAWDYAPALMHSPI